MCLYIREILCLFKLQKYYTSVYLHLLFKQKYAFKHILCGKLGRKQIYISIFYFKLKIECKYTLIIICIYFNVCIRIIIIYFIHIYDHHVAYILITFFVVLRKDYNTGYIDEKICERKSRII